MESEIVQIMQSLRDIQAALNKLLERSYAHDTDIKVLEQRFEENERISSKRIDDIDERTRPKGAMELLKNAGVVVGVILSSIALFNSLMGRK